MSPKEGFISSILLFVVFYLINQTKKEVFPHQPWGNDFDKLLNCDKQTYHDGEQGDTFNQGGSQDHVGTNVTSHFRLTGDGGHSVLTNVTDTETGANGCQTSTDAGANVTYSD